MVAAVFYPNCLLSSVALKAAKDGGGCVAWSTNLIIPDTVCTQFTPELTAAANYHVRVVGFS
jgi:hypothetical protein